jgi:hypothetical protein
MSPDWLFGEFRKDRIDFGWTYIFKELENKESFLKPTIQFVTEEKEDRVRGWGP